MRTIGLQTVHKCVVPLGLDPVGLRRKDSDVWLNSLHIMRTDIARWPRTRQNYDTYNVKSALIYAYYFM